MSRIDYKRYNNNQGQQVTLILAQAIQAYAYKVD